MGQGEDSVLDVEGIERALRAVEPGACLVPSRVLRRIIRKDRGLPPIGLRVPHDHCYVIDGEALIQVVEPDELRLAPGEGPPRCALLIACDEDDISAPSGPPPGDVLRTYWRRLFHARVHHELEQRLISGRLTRAMVRSRVERIGQVEFDEVRSVLWSDKLLLPPSDDRSVYIEFAAIYLELRAFAPHLLASTFPALLDRGAIDSIISDDLDPATLLEQTRPAGAADPEPAPSDDDDDDPEPVTPIRPARPSARLLERADRAARLGNVVRAAILHARAGSEGARDDLDSLANRLAEAVGFDEGQRDALRRALAPLLRPAAEGVAAVEARLLYDLQKVCIDREREVSKVDLIEWARTGGRRPLKRPLPDLQDVLACKHLNTASHRLRKARLDDRDRRRLAEVLGEATHRAEHHLRSRLRPKFEAVLLGVGLTPRDLPERVAFGKLVEECLDRIVERGYLGMGDLRDALSRNNLKLPDLAGVRELLAGDRLLRADRALAEALDGVYHRGEIYLRGLQRLSALAFGTKVGRALTRYVALPIGGAFVALEGLQHLVGLVTHPIFHVEVKLLNPVSFVIVATLAFGLLHSAAFRRGFWRACRAAFRVVRVVTYDLPGWVLRRPIVSAVVDSPGFRLVARSLVVPAALTAMAWLALPRGVRGSLLAQSFAGVSFLAVGLLLNSRFGRDLGESAADGLATGLERLRLGIIPAAYRFIMDVFGRLLEGIDRVLYKVDEYLRFRAGQGRVLFAVKAIGGVVWSIVTYVVRFCVNLLIEPQINPIKHFPVVTVSHKLLLPMIPGLARALNISLGEAGMLMTGVPGIFGFLVWELKENWRLYEANRPRTLRPALIGHHGETMVRLLRPGFHSGTLPRLTHRLRRAERRAAEQGRRQVHRTREAMHHVAEAVERFVDRELAPLLAAEPSLAGATIEAGAVGVGSNRIRVELTHSGRPGRGLRLSFEEQSGWLIVGVVEPGWLDSLSPEGRLALGAALAGLYKMAGVDLVREQIRASLPDDSRLYDIASEGLVVWPGEGFESEAIYDLRDGPLIAPKFTIASGPIDLPTLDGGRLRFRDVEITWHDWVAHWEHGGGRVIVEAASLVVGDEDLRRERSLS